MQRKYHHLLKKRVMLYQVGIHTPVHEEKKEFLHKIMNTRIRDNEWDTKEPGCVAIWRNYISESDLIKVRCVTAQVDLFVLEYGNEYVVFFGDRCEKNFDLQLNFLGKHYRTTILDILEYNLSPDSEFLLSLSA